MTYDVQTPAVARLWHYAPDYARGYEVRRSFLTEIITSRNGTEQRRSLRDVPRLSVRYSTIIEGEALAAAKQDLRFGQNLPRAVPDWSRFALTTSSASAGALALAVDPAPAWLADGQLAYLCSSTSSELMLIDYVDGAAINLAAPLDSAWPSGSVIRPVIYGLLPGNIRAGRLNRGAQEFDIEARAYPGGEPPEDEGAEVDTFNGYEVFTIEPDQAGSPSTSYLYPVEQIDFDIGRTAEFRPVVQHQLLTECEFIGRSRAEAVALEQFFLRKKGRRSAFYRPTCEKDLRLAVNATGASSIDVPGTTLAADWSNADAPHTDTALEIVLKNGTRLRRLITGVSSVSGRSRIALNASTTASIADVARISWMPLVRFASDDLVTLWRSPMSATIRASFQSLRLS